MKLSLVVARGKAAGKVIPINLPEFLIGRDPGCHLRPASPQVSKRHCLLATRNGKAVLRDLGSGNGTVVNGWRIDQETELHDGDHVKIGPLEFAVRVEYVIPENAGSDTVETTMAALLAATEATLSDRPEEKVPEGSTELTLPPPPEPVTAPPPADRPEPARPSREVLSSGDAAKKILDQMRRRQR